MKLLQISVDFKFYPEAENGAFPPKYLQTRQIKLPPHLINSSLKSVLHFTKHSCASGNFWLEVCNWDTLEKMHAFRKKSMT